MEEGNIMIIIEVLLDLFLIVFVLVMFGLGFELIFGDFVCVLKYKGVVVFVFVL